MSADFVQLRADFLAREGGGEIEARRDCGGVLCLVGTSCRVDS